MSNKISRPNVLLIMTDQQRYDTLGCYGNSRIFTPNIDRLANEGVLFERCYVQNSVCAPSRACIVTSRYPRICRLNANGRPLPNDEILLTKILAEAGYDCGLIGKFHIDACEHGRTEPRRDDGFRIFEWAHDPDHASPYNHYHGWLRGKGILNFKMNPPIPQELSYTHWCVERGIAFLEDHYQNYPEKPFFLWLNIFDPHDGPAPDQRYLDMYPLDKIPKPKYMDGELENKPPSQQYGFQWGYGGRRKGYAQLTEEERLTLISEYYAKCTQIDTEVQKILNYLKEMDIEENTIVIYTSDHGDMLCDHGLVLKGPYFYEPAIRVPLIIKWPARIKSGLRRKELVQSIDIMPTIFEAIGLTLPWYVQGQSLLTLCIDSASSPIREWAYCEYRESNFPHTPPVYATMVRTERYKLIHYHGEMYGELYDLETDPDEYINLWSKEMELREELERLLLDVFYLTEAPNLKRISNW